MAGKRTTSAAALTIGLFLILLPAQAFSLAPTDGGLAALTDSQISVRDLAAQQEMVFWAECMFWTTVVSLVVSIFALLGLLNSLRQTRASIAVTRDAAFLEQRPWLAVSGVEILNIDIGDWNENGTHGSFVHNPQGNRVFIFGNFTVRNEGKTPAFGIQYTTTFVNSDSSDPKPQLRSQPSYSGVLGPDMTERVAFMHDAGLKAGSESLGAPQLTISIEYRHYKRNDKLRTVSTAILAMELTAEEREMNAAAVLLSRMDVINGTNVDPHHMYIVEMN
ncbi:hypothetical protein ACLE20_04730 [Rhizobium sp. YIM 134829]|uniref:hypothetical protein n=1 Tax=Rhizobium sp. YIM 134829 TaxID=3390453 RepID=UPI0039784E97